MPAEGVGSIYNSFKVELLNGNHDLVNDDLRLALMSGYLEDIDGQTKWADISASEAAGTGYNAGGKAVSTIIITQDNVNNWAKFDADDVTWTGLLLTAPATGIPSHAVLYNNTHPDKGLICFWYLGTTATDGGNYTIQFNVAGILVLA
jgi:hypothetical protein